MVTESDVRHVAALARLGLDEARVPVLVGELNRILEHMEALGRVTGGDAGQATSADGMPLRQDAGPPTPLAAPREQFAPFLREGFFIVPRLATHETDGEGESASP